MSTNQRNALAIVAAHYIMTQAILGMRGGEINAVILAKAALGLDVPFSKLQPLRNRAWDFIKAYGADGVAARFKTLELPGADVAERIRFTEVQAARKAFGIAG